MGGPEMKRRTAAHVGPVRMLKFADRGVHPRWADRERMRRVSVTVFLQVSMTEEV